ncbi:MAG: acyl carrier protein [Acidobacteria bacterium]|nr:acyl carrier protein [Acidobacteriota bacterium]
MTEEQAREVMRTVLRPIAPEADLDSVVAGETLQEALDLDSIDFLQFVAGLAEVTRRDIPERDYAQLSTVEGCVDYLTTSH